jgi:ferrous iron transport protein B
VKTAGTTILVISIALWFLASFPRAPVSADVATMETEAAALSAQNRAAEAGEKLAAAHDLQARQQLEHSLAGRMGRLIEPALKPLGFDWQIGIGIVSSFAAREVIVSTLAVVYGVGADHAEENADSLYDTLRAAKRSNGSPVFNVANCFSLLVFYVLAAQCLPTQAVVRRETKTWKWPAFQLFYMTALAYVASLVVYQVLAHLGFG